MAAVAFGAILSCEKETLVEEQETVVPADKPVSGETWSFTANMENPMTKMTDMDGSGEFAWENGDEIKILWAGGNTTANASVSAGVTTFEPTGLPSAGTAIWLVYPSSMTASLDAGNLVVNMPAVQKDALHGYFVAKAEVGDAAVSFKHPVCYYKFVVDGDGTDVTRLELTSAGGENLSAATLTLSFDGSGVPSVASVGTGASSITVDFSGSGTYYVPVVPDVSPAANDLTFQFKRTENAAYVKAGAYRHASAITNNRADIVNWGSLPAKATNRYVSTTGSSENNGATADKPWDWATFKGFMENSSSRDAATLALYDGVNIRFAAGTYSPTAKVVPQINIRTNLIGENAATTIFDGGSSSQIFFDIYYASASGETIIFKNFTVQNFNNTSSDGGAFRIGNGTRVFNIHFEDCVFINNQASASNKSGGVFCVNGATTISLKNCSFTKNHATAYGGVMTVVKNITATASFENCTFGDGTSANRNYSNSGSVFHSANAQNHSFKDCIFDYNQGSGNWGSVIYLTESVNSKLFLDNCLFKNNISKNRGIVSANAPRAIYMNNVTFKNNTVTDATGYGICAHANNQAVICMNNVTSYNNHNSNVSPTDNNWSFNCDGSLLMVNSTIVDNTPQHVFRALTSTSKVSICNNIVINREGTAPFTIHADATCVNNGHNLRSSDANQGNTPANATDMFSVTDASLDGSYSESWSSTNKYGVYSWINNLLGFTPATQDEVEDTIKDYDYTIVGVEHIGTDFYNWLVSIGTIGKDGRSVARAGDWWPGAYQN